MDLEIPMVQEMLEPADEELEEDPDAQVRPVKIVLAIMQGPPHLWTLAKDFHQANNKANLYLI